MIDFELTYWTWFILAVVLFGLEILAPGVIFLWVGIAAMVTGLLMLVIPALGWQASLVVFAVLSVVSAIGGKRFVKARPVKSENETLNRRAEQYVGQVFELVAAISDGRGKVAIGDGEWIVTGPDTPEGAHVRVTGTDGARLAVEPVDQGSS